MAAGLATGAGGTEGAGGAMGPEGPKGEGFAMAAGGDTGALACAWGPVCADGIRATADEGAVDSRLGPNRA